MGAAVGQQPRLSCQVSEQWDDALEVDCHERQPAYTTNEEIALPGNVTQEGCLAGSAGKRSHVSEQSTDVWTAQCEEREVKPLTLPSVHPGKKLCEGSHR